jgi:hypothetical protein
VGRGDLLIAASPENAVEGHPKLVTPEKRPLLLTDADFLEERVVV